MQSLKIFRMYCSDKYGSLLSVFILKRPFSSSQEIISPFSAYSKTAKIINFEKNMGSHLNKAFLGLGRQSPRIISRRSYDCISSKLQSLF